jgi:hypothetical protein
MVVVLKKGMKKEDIEKLLKKTKRKTKGFNSKKHCGIISIKEDPVEIQRKMRDEWE